MRHLATIARAAGLQTLIAEARRIGSASEFSRLTAGLLDGKGALYLLPVRQFVSGEGPRKSDNDPNCGLCDFRVSVGPLGLHKPL